MSDFKKILMGCLLAPALALAVYAEGLTELSMAAPERASPGETVTVSLNGSGGSEVKFAQFTVDYDPDVLTLQSVVPGDRAPALNYNSKVPGKIYCIWNSLSAVDPDGVWLNCVFVVNDGVGGSTAVRIDPDEDLIFGTLENFGAPGGDTEAALAIVPSTAGETLPPAVTPTPVATAAPVTLPESSQTVQLGQTIELKPNSGGQALFWGSSDETVATVENGIITTQGPGVAVITAMTADGAQSASCEVTVEDKPPETAANAESGSSHTETDAAAPAAGSAPDASEAKSTAAPVAITAAAVVCAAGGAAVWFRKKKRQ